MLDQEQLEKVKSEAHGRIGVIFSTWDLLHAGHCLVLEFAKANCDFLVVGLHTDPSLERPHKNKPIMSLDERRILVKANRYIDGFIEYETEQDHYDILVQLKPAVRVLGSDYLNMENFTGKDLDIPILYHDRSHGWSSSSLRDRIWQAENARRIN